MSRFGRPHTAISRKVVGKNVHATIPNGNMGYDQYTVTDDCSCLTYFCCSLRASSPIWASEQASRERSSEGPRKGELATIFLKFSFSPRKGDSAKA